MAEEQEAMKKVFDEFDMDGSGAICCKELKNVLKQLYSDESEEDLEMDAKTMLEEADKDANGVITFDEFLAILKAQEK